MGGAVEDNTHASVQEYYGKVLAKTADLKTNACCTSERPPPHLIRIFGKIHDEVTSKYYGCGLVLPDALSGCKVLDLGCGAGRDVYVLSALVGETGTVTGIDMTEEQLSTARAHQQYHADAFGFSKVNTEFVQGYIEKLSAFEDDTFDVVVSNCVINLSPDKDSVLREVFRVLKPGGELYFSDVYCNRRVPKKLVEDPVLFGECLSGALYWNDFLTSAQRAGFGDPRLVDKGTRITVQNEKIQEMLAGYEFYSALYRLFKLPNLLEKDCEDYGQAVIYKGTVTDDGTPEGKPKVSFILDGHHEFMKGKIYPVCGNTWHMLYSTRFKQHFDFLGNFDTHYGIFPGCGKNIPFATGASSGGGGSCC